MSTKWITPTATERDGTSQTLRTLDALSPDYVSVDERSVRDIIEFARAYGKMLRYFNENNQPEGDFSAFIGSVSGDDVATLLETPEKMDPDRHPALFRPHFTLFLTFLKLLQAQTNDLNALTRRHLDFHFQRFLRLSARKAVPDRVDLLFTMADREQRVFVPAGTILSAGVDSAGKDQLYRTAKNLVVNRARIERVSSVHVERRLIGVAESWHRHRNDPVAGRLEMLCIAYGRPLPGDPLPDYPGTTPTPLLTDMAVEMKLTQLERLVDFSRTGLFSTMSELRALLLLTEPGFAEVTAANRRTAYEKRIDAIAAKRKTAYQRPTATNLSFDAYANAALGPLAVPDRADVTTLRGYWNALLEVEAYFGMPIEDFVSLLAMILGDGATWDANYARYAPNAERLLNRAHHEKRREERKAMLLAQRRTMGYWAALQTALFGDVDVLKTDAYIGEFEDGLRSYLTERDFKTLQEVRAAERWDEVCALLAHAMGTRLGQTPPRKDVWLNLVPAADARAVLSTRTKPGPDGKLPFATFGMATETDDTAPVPILGFGVTSPLLALSAGTRTVTVTLGLRAEGYDYEQLKTLFNDGFGRVDALDRNISPLAIEVSTAKGWLRVTPDKKASVFGKYLTLIGTNSIWNDRNQAPGLKLVFTLAEGDPPLAPLPNAPDGMDARWPAIRILMQAVWSESERRYVHCYRELSSLFVGAVRLQVSVTGLMPSAIENDDWIVDPKKPFLPFGTVPTVGARLSFGHPELVTKKIERLRCSFQWLDVPANLTEHYANYGITPSFNANVRFLDLSGPKELAGNQALFGTNTAATTTIDAPAITAPLPPDPMQSIRGFDARVTTWRRFLQWELGAPDFQHRTYPTLSSAKALQLSLDLANPNTNKTNLSPTSYQVKPPYTPKLAFLKVDYESSSEFVVFKAEDGDRVERAYHVHPFGLVELATDDKSEELPFLPRYDMESALCIGLANVSLPDTVTLLFQLDEGSADRDIAAPQVTWSQLSGNRWIPLGHNVVEDATRGFQTSGVVELALREAEPSTMFPAHLTWVRASVTQDAASLCDTRAVFAQTVNAVFDDRGNAPDHYRVPLPPGTITKLRSPIAGITAVAQPYASYGGQSAEDERTFPTRVSERLRHKDRALSTWDYERIVLDAFPQIFKAKCIPMHEDAPGDVDVLVIPNVRMLPTNELGPKAPMTLLSTIEAFLTARAPGCARITVRNAIFRAVRIRLGVRFSEPGNDAYWSGRLEEELNRFLSPWAYDDGADITVGGRIHASNIVDFVDRRPYVDYIGGITLFTTDDEGEHFTFVRPPQDGGQYFVDAGGPDRVLVAYPHHRIDVLVAEHYDARLYQGISYMELEMDFVVG